MEDKAAFYSGHKVVAMPSEGSFGGVSVRDGSVASDGRPANPYQRRGRSRSSGRGPVSRSRDIVQDVYDRMGVNYIRGRPSIDNLLEDNKALGGVQRGTPERSFPSRGRSSSQGGEYGDSRQRLSSGTGSKWPPNGAANSSETNVDPAILPSARSNDHTGKAAMSRSTHLPPRSYRPSQSDSRDEDYKTNNVNAPDDERDAVSVVSAKSSKSVKERINAYGASIRAASGSRANIGTNRANVRNTYGNNFNKRSHPPQVNMQDEVTGTNAAEKDVADSSVAASNFDHYSAVSTGRNRYSTANSISHRSAKSSIADAFLSSIARPPANSSSFHDVGISRNIAVVEIPHNDLRQSGDLASIAASSVSGDDFASSPMKRPSTRNGVSSFGRPNENSDNIVIEKLVEASMKAQTATWNKKFEAEMRRIEYRLEQEFKQRIEELEKRNQELERRLVDRGL